MPQAATRYTVIIVKELKNPYNVGADDTPQHKTHKWMAIVSDKETNILTKSIMKSIIFVADNLIHQKAVLLLWVCQVFLDVSKGSKSTPSPTLEVGESTVKFSSRWLLNQLISHLNQHMSYKCIHKKFGTLLYRKGGDVLVSLSWALSNSNMYADNETAHITLHENAETD